jgi:biopolymer transport protein ExbD
MAELNTGGGGGGGKHGKKRAKKLSTRVDMTPMVDLAFLLLTFFVLTATFNKPKVMELNFPFDKETPDEPISEVRNGLTIIATGKDKIYYYSGSLGKTEKLEATDYTANGLRKLLVDRNRDVVEQIRALGQKAQKTNMADSTFKREMVKIQSIPDALVVLIKNDDKATYKNIIDIVDELNITKVGRFVVVDELDPKEKVMLADATKLNP